MIFLYLVISLLIIHYAFFIGNAWIGLKRVKTDKGNFRENPKVTVIIPFRDESDVIMENVMSINSIDYPKDKFEVIYVNDDSGDDSEILIKKNIIKWNHRIINSHADINGRAFKKKAIEEAVNISNGEIIFLTDADCTVPSQWIKEIVSYFDDDTAMVSGPVTFKQQISLFEKIQKLEFAGLNLMGAGLIGAGKPTICSSANLAFRKSVFTELGGYKDNLNLSSGDDELLMHKIAGDSNYKIKFCFNKTALVFTRANKNLDEFKSQRKRWASKGLFYKNPWLVLQLILVFLFYMNLFVLPVLSYFVASELLILCLLSLCCKFTAEYLVLRNGKDFYFESSLLKYFLMGQVFQIPYILYASVLGAFGGFKWKGRNLRR